MLTKNLKGGIQKKTPNIELPFMDSLSEYEPCTMNDTEWRVVEQCLFSAMLHSVCPDVIVAGQFIQNARINGKQYIVYVLLNPSEAAFVLLPHKSIKIHP